MVKIFLINYLDKCKAVRLIHITKRDVSCSNDFSVNLRYNEGGKNILMA